MPRLADVIVKGATFLFRTKAEAEARAKIGGSCFVLTKPIEGSREFAGRQLHVPYLISNRHVVWTGGASVPSVNRRDGKKPDIFEYEPTDWTVHPDGDDLAAICVYGDFKNLVHDISHINTEQILTRDGMKKLNIGVGDDVFMIGRFINHQGSTFNKPAARFGNISMMEEPIWVKASNRHQTSISVEMRSRTGFSGAPVAVYRIGTTLLDTAHPTDFWGFLGVNWGYILDEDGENTWLNGVVPAYKVLELLEEPTLKKRHDEITADTKRQAAQSGGAQQAFASDDSAVSPEDAASDANPNHLKDFNSLVGLAARKLKPDAQT